MSKTKILLSILFISICNCSYAQKDTVEYFLDYWGKKCEPHQGHYYRFAFKEGKWWHAQDFYTANNVLEKDALFSDDSMKVKEGMVYFYHPNGRIKKKSRYIKGLMEGVVKEYDTAGRLIDSGIYSKDIPKKARVKWNDKGQVIFKGIYDEEGYGVGQEWEYHDDGKLSSYGITTVGHKKDSIWTFYYTTGIMSCQDYFDKGSRMGRMCYDEKGEKYDGACEDVPARPVEKEETIGMRFNQRYSDMKQSNYKINEQTGSMSGTFDESYKFKKGTYIVFRVYVNEKGNMTDVEVLHKVHPKVDDMLVDIYKGITKFKPAMQGNRVRKASFEQTFPLSGF